MKSRILLGRKPNTDIHLISQRVWDYWQSKYKVELTHTIIKGRSYKNIWGNPTRVDR